MKSLLQILFLLLLAGCFYKNIHVEGYKINHKEMKIVGELIYFNETAGKRENLVFWNSKEPFPSLGIGHFIWYPKNYTNTFGNSLPMLINFYQQQGIAVPAILLTEFAPWDTKEEFENFKINYPNIIEDIIVFFESTKDVQVEYMFNRITVALNNIVNSSSNKNKIIFQFNRIMNEKNGIYLIVDYVNFKGEGASVSSNSGLRSVLENMSGDENGKIVFLDFANSCKDVLTNRIYNSKNYEEAKFLSGWMKRCNAYLIKY